ncbi:MAG TPA: hypothetical protein VE782_08170, partial [Myxococcaceae bacterium]|nr:hypothetical protein [Myxococcaceae bacterium]
RRNQQSLSILESQLDQVNKRIQLASDARSKSALEETLRQFTDRRNQVSADLQAAQKAGGRQVLLDWITLGPELGVDAALDAEVKRIEPGGAAH